jgi:hypothetical protein
MNDWLAMGALVGGICLTFAGFISWAAWQGILWGM